MATAMGKWINTGMYAWSPYLAGGEDPSLPPPGSLYTEGPLYYGGVSVPGKPVGEFKSWIVYNPISKTLQQIINWKSGPDYANPYADWYKKQGK